VLSLTIIIPTLNEAAGVALAVSRARALAETGVVVADVIVADGGSRDGTPQIAETAGAHVVPCPRGRGTQQNCAARQARGEVLLFLHADTWLDPEAASQIEAALSDVRVWGGAFRQRIEAEGLLFRLLERGNAWRAGYCDLPYGDQGIFIRRSVFERVGGFPEVPLMEDLILIKALGREFRPALLPGPLYVSARRWERHGILRQTLRNWLLVALFQLGISPQCLARLYRPHAE
jgi:rSAM/selenodomain-associated transferase 2